MSNRILVTLCLRRRWRLRLVRGALFHVVSLGPATVILFRRSARCARP